MENLSIQIGERLKKFRIKINKTQTQIAGELGLITQTYSRYEKGDRDIPDKVKLKLKEMKMNIEWLLTGEGEMFTSQETLPAVKQKTIPLLRQTVSCGPGQDWQDADNIESYIEPLSLASHGKELYAFRSRGISMEGTGIQDGDILIFDGARDQQLQDDIYVFGYNGEAFCKLLRFDFFSGKTHVYSVRDTDLKKAELLRTLDSTTEGFQIFGRVLCWIHENRLMWR